MTSAVLVGRENVCAVQHVVDEPGVFFTGAVFTTEHHENAFYTMKKRSPACDERGDNFMHSYFENENLGTILVLIC